MKIEVIAALPSDTEAIVYLFRQSDRLSEQLNIFSNAVLLKQDFKAEAKQTVTLYENGQRAYLVGLGKTPKEADIIKILRSFFFKQKTILPNNTVIHLTAGNIESDWIEAIANGCMLADYDLGPYKTEAKKDPSFFDKAPELKLLVAEKEVETSAVKARFGAAVAATQIRIMQLMNAPSNKKYPQILAEWAVDSSRQHGYSVTVWDETQCEREGLEALLAVSLGSKNPPRFILLEYKHPEATEKVGLVGKGVTFDTGGVSLKQSTNMHYMKSDMGGAAAVLGTFEAVAKLKLPVHLVGAIPVTENSIDGLAVKPGDVVGSYSGKTIEIIDTDAEGRVILADALSYLKRNFNPDVIIDLATLTGSCVATLGYSAAGLFTNNDALAQDLYDSGQQTGEKLWRLPLWDDYKDDLKSDVADVKNFHGKPVAGAIVAAKFLEVFVEGHPRWAHLDIAGTAFADSEFGTMKSGTAYGIRLLLHWLQRNK